MGPTAPRFGGAEYLHEQIRDAYRPPASSGLHPLVTRPRVGFVVWFVISARGLFHRQKGAELPLVMASILLLVAVLIPYLLWRVWRTDQEPRSPLENAVTFSDWASGQDVWQSQLKGTGMLQPLAAVAFGLTAFGIAYARGSNRRRSALEQMSQMNGRSFSWKSAISRTCMSQNCRSW